MYARYRPIAKYYGAPVMYAERHCIEVAAQNVARMTKITNRAGTVYAFTMALLPYPDE